VSQETKTPAQHHDLESNEWPALFRRIVKDLASIVQAEIRLFQAGLTPIFSAAVDRLLGNVIALAALIVGGLCLLAASLVFLHRWLAWDAALLITGAVSLFASYVSSRVATMRADQSIAELERSFERYPKDGDDISR